MEQSDAKVLRDTALTMVGHLGALDIVLKSLIETHSFPEILQKSFQASMTRAMAGLLNSTIIPDLTINATEEILAVYTRAIQQTVNADDVAKAELKASREAAKD